MAEDMSIAGSEASLSGWPQRLSKNRSFDFVERTNLSDVQG